MWLCCAFSFIISYMLWLLKMDNPTLKNSLIHNRFLREMEEKYSGTALPSELKDIVRDARMLFKLDRSSTEWKQAHGNKVDSYSAKENRDIIRLQQAAKSLTDTLRTRLVNAEA